MANNVMAVLDGGRPQTLNNVNTPADVLSALGSDGNYTVTINGQPASVDTVLEDYQQVKFTEMIKGGF